MECHVTFKLRFWLCVCVWVLKTKANRKITWHATGYPFAMFESQYSGLCCGSCCCCCWDLHTTTGPVISPVKILLVGRFSFFLFLSFLLSDQPNAQFTISRLFSNKVSKRPCVILLESFGGIFAKLVGLFVFLFSRPVNRYRRFDKGFVTFYNALAIFTLLFHGSVNISGSLLLKYRHYWCHYSKSMGFLYIDETIKTI